MQLSSRGEIKQRYTQLNLQIPDLNSSQLPSEFFKRLVDYGQVSQSNLLPLYELYAGSNLPDKEKYTAFEYIRRLQLPPTVSHGY